MTAVETLIKSHLSHRSGSTIPPDGPMPQPELLKQKEKLLENQQPQNETKTRKNKVTCSEKVFANQISTSAKKQIALHYARLKRDTSR